MGRAVFHNHVATSTKVGVAGCHVGEADVGVSHLNASTRHNHYQNQQSAQEVSDKNYGLSPSRCRVYHNRESSTDAGQMPPPKWKSRINESNVPLYHEPESAASTMEMRDVKPDLVNKPQRGPIRHTGKGNTDAGLKFGNRMP